MRIFSAALINTLKEGFEFVHLVKFKINTTDFCLTDAEDSISYDGNNYVPGFIDEIGDIEQTNEPKMGDINPIIYSADNSFTGLFLSENWMNKPFEVRRQIYNKRGGLVDTVVVFSGYVSSFDIDHEDSRIKLTVSSVWADFEKTSGTRTNLSSQQRHYPDDWAFRHSASAVKKIPWGKPGVSPVSGKGTGPRLSGPTGR